MKHVIMKRWVRALRSGRYRQTTGKLRARNKAGNATNNFCCLGVLCDLYAQDHPEAGWVAKKNDDPWASERAECTFSAEKNVPADADLYVERATTALPRFVQEWAGIANCAGRFTLTQRRRAALLGTKVKEQPAGESNVELVVLNDDEEFNFQQLADVIEKHWRKL